MRRLLVASPLLAALVLDVTPAAAQTTAAPFRLNEDWMWFSLSNHADTADGRPFNDGWSPIVAGQVLADQRVMPGRLEWSFDWGASRCAASTSWRSDPRRRRHAPAIDP